MTSPSNNTPLDIEQPEALRAYLVQTGRIDADEAIEIETLAGGVSNKTVRVARPSGETWVLKQALAKLRVKADWFSDPARIEREALGMRHLAELAPGRIPALVFEDRAHHLLAMQAVPEPHEVWKNVLLDGRATVKQAQAFGALLGNIHRGGHERRDELAPVFRDRSYFENLRLEPYYGYAAEQCPAAAAFLHSLIDATRQRCFTLVHGDYSPKNVLIQGGRLILLDHEVIHWGDPAFDIGFSMTHLLSKAHHMPAHREAMRGLAEAHWSHYLEAAGDTAFADALEPHAVRHTLGCLLARVDGRSPLEYLTEADRDRQRGAVLKLIDAPPERMDALFDAFLDHVSHAHD